MNSPHFSHSRPKGPRARALARPLGLVALALVLFASGCAGWGIEVRAPRITISDVRLENVTLFEQSYRLKLRVQNPNSTALHVTGLEYDVELNGERFAQGLSAQDVEIPAMGSALVEVQAVSTTLAFLKQLRTLERGQTETVSYRVKGRVYLSWGRRLSFDHSGTVDLMPPG